MALRVLAFFCLAFGLAAPAAVSAFEVDADVRSDRAAIEALQHQLNDLGFDAGEPDGVFGRRTQAAIEAFSTRFPGDGEAGLTPATLEHVLAIHRGRFASPFGAGILVEPSDYLPTSLFAATDIRTHSPDCENCNVTTMMHGSADLNGDGAADLVLHQHAQDRSYEVVDVPTPLSIFAGEPGSARSMHAPDFLPDPMPKRVHAREAVFGDFNGDGAKDVFVAATGLDAPPFPGEQNVLLLSGPAGLGDASESHLPAIDDMAHGADAADIDGDGDLDIFVVTNQGASDVLPYLLRNDGTGNFAMEEAASILDPALIDFRRSGRRFEAEYSTVRFADMNADGAPDLLLLARGEEPSRESRGATVRQSLLVLNDGEGRFPLDGVAELPTDRWGARTFTNDAEPIDLDGDGALDLVLTQSTRPRGGFWRGHYVQVLMQEDGQFVDRTAERLWPQGYDIDLDRLSFADKTRMVDFDADGDRDLVTATLSPAFRDSVGDQAITIGLNNGDGVFAPVDPDWIAEGPGGDRGYRARQQITGDFNGDGVADIASYQLIGDYGDGEDRTYGAAIYLHRPAPN